jgi:alpha-N-arabinofuranosidase
LFIRGKDSLPAVSISASVDKAGKTHISLVNMDPSKNHAVQLDLGKTMKSVSGRILQSGSLKDHNSFEQPEKVKPRIFNDAKLKDKQLSLQLPAASVIVLELQ